MAQITKDSRPFILFVLAGTTYAIASEEVLHMEMLQQITPVPNASPFVEGVAFSRGQVIPAVNLRVRFGLPRVPHTPRTRLLIVQVENRAVGLIVDFAREFKPIPASSIQPPDGMLSSMSGGYLRGIANHEDRLILILDLQAVLNLNEIPQFPVSQMTTPP